MKHFAILAAVAIFAVGTIAAAPAVAREIAPPIPAHATVIAPPTPPHQVSRVFALLGFLAFFPVVLGTFAANTHISDGSIRLVEQLVSLLDTSGVSTTYILKTGGLKSSVKTVKSEDQHGAYQGMGAALGDRSGQMTLQFVNSGDLEPTPLQYFSALDASGVAKKLILLDVGDKFGALEDATIECTVIACINPTAITATLPSQVPTGS